MSLYWFSAPRSWIEPSSCTPIGVKKTGGEEHNHHGGSKGIQSELAPTPETLWPVPDKDQVDHEKATQVADHHSGSSGTTDLFSRAMSFVGSGVRRLFFLASIT